MKIPKIIVIILILSMMITSGLVGCAKPPDNVEQGASEKETIRIGVASYSFGEKWQTYMYDAMKAEAEKIGNVELVFTDGKADSATQLGNVENLISQGVDAIILCIVDTSAPAPFIDLAKNAGIPLIGVNQYFEGADAYVGSRSIDAGIMQMEEVAKLLNYQGNVAILQGMMGHEAAVMRTEGNKQIIKKHEGLNLVRENTAKWDRAEGMTLMENWLQSGEKIDAVVANNDEMAIGAIMALKAEGKLDDVIVAGIDATIDALEFVKSGEMDVTIFQSPFGQGGGSVRVAVDMVNGKTVEKETWIPFEVVTKENVSEYEAKWK